MKYIHKVFVTGCIWMTAISLLFFAVASLINSTEQTFSTVGMSISQYLWILLFSFLIAAAGLILSCNRIRAVFRVLIHYAVVLTGFIVIFAVRGNLSLDSASKIFVAIVIFTFFYAIIMAVYLSLLHTLGKLSKQKNAPKEYRSIFR